MANNTFHPFPRLPTELREEIWRFCLPHRVSEMDYPIDWMVYDSFGPKPKDKLPCSLISTSISNARPPLLATVCRESRRVALSSGNWSSVLEEESGSWPLEANWLAANLVTREYWQDPLRDSAHLNWTTSYEADLGYQTDGHPLDSLVWEAKLVNGLDMRSTCPRDNISDDNTGSDKGLFDEDAADTSSAMNTVE
ncbi:hypothetical protein D6D29_06091 [Aureobasidium pullulans]|nr:hypothetical protein D6D29_06091 [Aureobasidium pullulans]